LANQGNEAVFRVIRHVDIWVRWFTGIFLAFCGLLVVIYSIYIGIKFFMAKDDGARANAKSQLIYALIGAMSVTMVIMVTRWAIPREGTVLGPAGGVNSIQSFPWQSGVAHPVRTTYAALLTVTNSILDIVFSGTVIFGIYIGWQFMRAEDEGKRKNAKNQLFYTVLGCVAVVLLIFITSTFLGNAHRMG